MIQYILECIAFQLVFLIIYDFLLKRETFFQWNRTYLIGTYMLSMLLPWIKIEALKTAVPEKYYAYPEFLWEGNDLFITGTTKEASGMTLSWESGIFYGGMVLATLYFGYKLYHLWLLRRSGQVKHFPNFTRIIVANSQMAFSFFRSIFLGDKVLEREYEGIIQHELVHIEQKHTWDLLFFELMRIVGWFNPLVYVYQNRVSELHEFIADAHVAKTHKKEQYELLLSQVFQTENISFINQFFKSSLIKKRILMLQKTKSKGVWQLKYLLMIPLVFGMLVYTSSEAQMNNGSESGQNPEDAELIERIKSKIEKDVLEQGSLFKVHYNFRDLYNVKGDKTILSKEVYFENEILTKMYFEEIVNSIESKDEKSNDFNNRIPLPSSMRYENYVGRRKAFQILDVNLQYSVKAYSQLIGLVEKQDNYPWDHYIYEVENCKDLTGIELRGFNQRLEEIFEKKTSNFSNLILTDNDYAFRIYENKLVKDWTPIENSDSQGHVERKDNSITHIVGEYKHMTKGEKEQSNQLTNEIRESEAIDTLYITDGTFSTIITSNAKKEVSLKLRKPQSSDVPFAEVDEVPVFPGCENDDDKRGCFYENMREHIRKNFNYPKEAQEKGLQGRVAIMFTMNIEGDIANVKVRGPHKLLEDEAVRIISRLPKFKPGVHEGKEVYVTFSIPISFKLNNQPKGFQIINEKVEIFDEQQITTVKKYNELVRERQRLLKKTDKSNPIIVNLHEQLTVLKKKIHELEKLSQDYKNSSNVPFAKVENVPVFPGCEDAADKRGCFNKKIQRHISTHFKYPQEAQEKGIQGRVSIMFLIASNGNITSIAKRGPDKLLEDEAVRIISKLPRMQPGSHEGKNVDVPFSIPITFKLSNDSQNDIIKLSRDHGSNRVYIIDGVESTKAEYESRDENSVESIFILNKEASIKKYGQAGKNGVIEVKTKKGN